MQNWTSLFQKLRIEWLNIAILISLLLTRKRQCELHLIEINTLPFNCSFNCTRTEIYFWPFLIPFFFFFFFFFQGWNRKFIALVFNFSFLIFAESFIWSFVNPGFRKLILRSLMNPYWPKLTRLSKEIWTPKSFSFLCICSLFSMVIPFSLSSTAGVSIV